MHHHVMKRLALKALLLLALGSTAITPTLVQATSTPTQVSSPHRYPDCPALPCG